MGFHEGAFCTVWEVTPFTDAFTKGRLSISKKDKTTGEYVQEFSGFVGFLGTAAAQKALRLQAKDRIKLGTTDVTTKYDPEKHITYYNFNIFSFETMEEANSNREQTGGTGQTSSQSVDEVDFSDIRLPF